MVKYSEEGAIVTHSKGDQGVGIVVKFWGEKYLSLYYLLCLENSDSNYKVIY